jgi:hypothetical protein
LTGLYAKNPARRGISANQLRAFPPPLGRGALVVVEEVVVGDGGSALLRRHLSEATAVRARALPLHNAQECAVLEDPCLRGVATAGAAGNAALALDAQHLPVLVEDGEKCGVVRVEPQGPALAVTDRIDCDLLRPGGLALDPVPELDEVGGEEGHVRVAARLHERARLAVHLLGHGESLAECLRGTERREVLRRTEVERRLLHLGREVWIYLYLEKI